MSKSTKIWLMIATCLVVVGSMIFAGVMTVLDWDFLKLDTTKYETNTYVITEDFGKIVINTQTADIKILPSEDDVCKVVCVEQTNAKHDVKVADGTLDIRLNDQRKWHEHIGFNFKMTQITVYLPQENHCAVAIRNTTGDIELAKDLTFKSVDIDISTGDVKIFASTTEQIAVVGITGDVILKNISAGAVTAHITTGDMIIKNVILNDDLDISSTTGDTKLKNVVTSGKLVAKKTTGDTKFEGCDASELFIKTTTGDVKGSLLSEKVFVTSTTTGDVDVPKTVAGGKCEITTTTGDIKITITP